MLADRRSHRLVARWDEVTRHASCVTFPAWVRIPAASRARRPRHKREPAPQAWGAFEYGRPFSEGPPTHRPSFDAASAAGLLDSPSTSVRVGLLAPVRRRADTWCQSSLGPRGNQD